MTASSGPAEVPMERSCSSQALRSAKAFPSRVGQPLDGLGERDSANRVSACGVERSTRFSFR